MESQYEAILKTLFGIARKYQKGYCYPGQRRLLVLLAERHGVQISRRSLNRRLAVMEGEGYFRRVRRFRRSAHGGLIFNTTLYSLGARAYNWAFRLGSWSRSIFSFYRVPKLAQHMSSSAGDLSPCGKVGALISKAVLKGAPSAAFSPP